VVEILLKNAIVLAMIAAGLAACAGNQTTQSADSGAVAVPAKKKECSYERSRGGTSRMQRVCHYVDAG
jgi:Flp pilus assembly protein TadD